MPGQYPDTFKPKSAADAIACDGAFAQLSNLDFLEKRPEFQQFLARHRTAVAELERAILEDDSISPEERERLRMRRKGIMDVIMDVDRQRTSNLKKLAQMGVDPADRLKGR